MSYLKDWTGTLIDRLYVYDILDVVHDNEVRLDLHDSSALNRLMDYMRELEGYRPLFYGDMEKLDLEAWYTYAATIRKGKTGYVVEITGTVCNTEQEDNEETYTIPLDEIGEEYDVLNYLEVQLTERFNTTIAELMEEN